MSESSLAAMVGTARRSEAQAPKVSVEDYQAFSFGRVGRSTQHRIEFRKADGYRLVLPYIDLKAIETRDPESGFRLHFIAREVEIEGSGLLKCYQLLRDERVAEIIEASRAVALALGEAEGIASSMKFSTM